MGLEGVREPSGVHLREEFICRALDSILAPMSSMPLPLRSTLARHVLLPRALMRMLVRSFSRESATDSDCRDCVGKWGLGHVPNVSATAGHPPPPGLFTHTVFFLDQLHQLVEDLLQGPEGSEGRVGGAGAGVMLLGSREGVRGNPVSQKERWMTEWGLQYGEGPYLALTLKFLPRNRCLRDLFLPSAGTSVRRSESNPGQ